MRRRWALVVVALLLGGACRSSAPAPNVVLDGRPRYADDEGVVTALNTRAVVLDNQRTYAISPKLRAFASSTLQPVTLSGRTGQYVQVGLAKKTVVWVATFSAVIQLQGSPRLAFHLGTLARVDARHRAFFRDGTVLRTELAALPPEKLPVRVRADIDVDRHRIRGFVQLSD